MSNDQYQTQVLTELRSITKWLSSQGERLARIETNHENLSSMINGITDQLDEISNVDKEQQNQLEKQSKQILVLSERSVSIEDQIKNILSIQVDHEERIRIQEQNASPEDVKIEASKEKYKFWSKVVANPWFKWGVAGSVIVLLIITGHENMIDKLLNLLR